MFGLYYSWLIMLQFVFVFGVIFFNGSFVQWYTSLDNKGRVYFYEEDSTESLWVLPQVISIPTLTLSETEPVIELFFR